MYSREYASFFAPPARVCLLLVQDVPRWNEPEDHYVYAVLCRDGDGPLYVKFGQTGDIAKRLRAVAQGSPIPAKWFATLKLPLYKKKATERALHQAFKKRKVKGEWFKFDATSEADKREFNDVSRQVFRQVLEKDCCWEKISVEALDAHARARQAAYRATMTTSKVKMQIRHERWRREYDSFRFDK